MSEISQVWFEQVKKLKVGQAIFIRVADKKEQIALAKEFEDERELYANADSIHASQIFITRTLKDMKQYVLLERKYRAPFKAFFRDAEGDFSKISVDPERQRILKLMVKDRKSRVEIENTLGGLTEKEIEEFFPAVVYKSMT